MRALDTIAIVTAPQARGGAIRTSHPRSHGNRHAVTNRPAHVLQPVVRRRTRRERIKIPARGHRFIHDNGIFRYHIAEYGSDLGWVE